MSSVVNFLSGITLYTALHLLGIVLIALLVNRFLKVLTKLIIKPASGQSRGAQVREQQTRTLAGVLYSAVSKVVWVIALLTALDLFGINPTPALTLAGLASVAVGFGAQNLVRDVITGFYIVLEDQYSVGDTIQFGDSTGRVEQLTLRRTVIRDARGALVTISNGDIRTVANLSRDWSQTFVDVALAPEVALDQPLAALEAACAELRSDSAWSQALVDGPRILGVQSLDRSATLVRLQARTAPTRQDEVARELRRRIHLELQRRGIPVSSVQRIELMGATELAAEAHSSLAGNER
ncbi:MAG TPA: mechanosensitive ion channel family protein [Candidatus Dormibacteraeota bacterium]|jgi:small-conductance mechanosensitive channel|nr:mechanosensitive ion channel family protein [Candidatus Dormibacteraeota bacterium]